MFRSLPLRLMVRAPTVLSAGRKCFLRLPAIIPKRACLEHIKRLMRGDFFSDVVLCGGSPIFSSFATSVQAMYGSSFVPTGLLAVCLVWHRSHAYLSSDPTLCVGSPIVFTFARVVCCCIVFKLILGSGMSTSTRSDSSGVPGGTSRGTKAPTGSGPSREARLG